MPSPHPVGLGLNTVLFPGVNLLSGCGGATGSCHTISESIDKVNYNVKKDF